MKKYYDGDYCFWNGDLYEIPHNYYIQIMNGVLSKTEIGLIIQKYGKL